MVLWHTATSEAKFPSTVVAKVCEKETTASSEFLTMINDAGKHRLFYTWLFVIQY
jgi:hypothetical protein